ncbi:MarR family transcriptional regulator [Saccharopolyspora hordei]|uniref:DNA-binding MarR family transcriptional regulator n=1 Tax=Saccharopolyspora hordei TaxID=1838 RepID=A0A853ANU6_9PSEU|nr:DNA-binding MarR family transcriptional regulator [Saccharopolyspora hordei]
MDDVADGLYEVAAFVGRHLLDRHGLSRTAMACLGRLNREGPTRLTALAASENVSQPSMSQLVHRLQRQGLVTRTDDPDDGRATLIAITDHGRELITVLRREQRQRLEKLMASLPANDAATLQLAMQVATPIVRKLTDLAHDVDS